MRFTTALCVSVLILSACINPKPPVRYDTSAKVSIADILDDSSSTATHPAPTLLRTKVEGAITDRNLVADRVPHSKLAKKASVVRDSNRRLQLLAEQAPDTDVLLLVETKAKFYSLINGGYRWTVYIKYSVAEPGKLQDALVRQMDLPAILSYAHEGEKEAIETVADEIATQAGKLIDAYLSGRIPAKRAAALKPASAKTSGSTGLVGDNIYFILVDRFHNGDPSNDAKIDLDDPAAWHGGDLKGVLDKLDYLEELGAKTLWLSPVFKSRYASFHGHGAFHGYWVEDIVTIDPRFGDEATLKALVDASHKRGMRVLLDLVVNHVGYDAPLLKEKPGWFHGEGSIQDWNNPTQLVRGDVHGLPDLAQENEEVFAMLLDAGLHWIDATNIDGYRLDAVKHVSLDFWARYNKHLQDHYDGELVLLGEMFHGQVKVVDDVQRQGEFTHMFDFPLAFALRDVFCKGRSPGRIAAVLSNDRLYSNPHSLVTFLDNHDLPRVRTECEGNIERVHHALTAQLAMRGTPALNYGTEAGMRGKSELEARANMRFDPADARALKAHVASHLKMRATSAALDRGETRLLALEDDLLLFARVVKEEAILVAIYTGAAARRYTLPKDVTAGSIRDLHTQKTQSKDTLTLQPGHTHLFSLAPREGEDFSAWVDAKATPRPVEIRVSGADLKPGESIFMVGSGPETGEWNPAQAVGPLRKEGQVYVTTVALPAGNAFAYKLIVRAKDGAVRWEPDPNRYVFVPNYGSNEPVKLDLNLRQG